MKISLNDDLSGASWVTYNVASTISLPDSPVTVYVQFKDAYNNTSDIINTITPATPSNLLYQDVSNTETSEWREFIAWGEINEPGEVFKQYNIYFSTNGTDYSLLSTEVDIAINYLIDINLNSSLMYYYKITAEDNHGNISKFSNIVSDQPDGQGGSDLASPTISNVTISDINTNGATIVEDLSEGAEKEYGFFTRMLSLSLRHQGVSTPIQFTVDALTKDKDFAGFSRGVARVLKKYIDEGEDVKTSDVCPECGSSLIYVGGCKSCSNMCGWSKCD
jgi:hypothetical protein